MIEIDPLTGLADKLESLFQIRKVTTVEELEKVEAEENAKPICFNGARVQVAGHFRPEAGLWIVDTELETLALVYGLQGTAEELRKSVKRCLERASYVRHLLLSDPSRYGEVVSIQRKRAYTLEVLLSTCGPASTREAVHSALLEVARESEILYTVGINVLNRANPAEEFSEDDLRQAFCWLLHDTKAWFIQSKHLIHQEPLQSLEMKNYRLSGRRILVLSPEARLHLIHGYNGTGKSSLVEALELSATGRIERFPETTDSPNDYYRSIANDLNKPAEIEVKFGSSTKKVTLGAGSIEQDVPSFSRAASFRLDQALMDRLTQPENRQRRGAIILNAFFPEDAPALEKYAQAQREAADSRKLLPEEVQTQLMAEKTLAEGVEKLFAWVDQDGSPAPERAIIDLALPVPFSFIEPLAKLSEELGLFVQAWQTGDFTVEVAKTLLLKLEIGIGQIRESAGQTLLTALRAFERLAGWYIEGDGSRSRERFRNVLDRWLETRALRDLIEKETQVVRALRLAELNGWTRDLAFRRPALDESQLTSYQEDLAKRQSDLLLQLGAHESSTSPSLGQTTGQSISPPQLSTEELTALSVVEGWIGISGLTDAIRTALRDQKTISVENLTIGRLGWADGCIAELQTLREEVLSLVERLQARDEPIRRDRVAKFNKALVDQRALTNAETGQDETWLRKVLSNLSLANALNELISLFTPARWAYEPIRLSHSIDSQGMHDVSFKTPTDQYIDLKFNTAELNVMVMALFFLCAPGQPNALGTLILDDPLQNMDELTATAVARGLGKLYKLWPAGLQAILLFHGEDQLERFRQEVPAAVYRLPWLSPIDLPNQDGEPKIIEVQTTLSSHLTGRQDLSALLQEF